MAGIPDKGCADVSLETVATVSSEDSCIHSSLCGNILLMATEYVVSAIEVWHKQFGMQDQAQQDGAWLRLFVKHHDGEAFAKLVRRHAAMVHAVCRRVLGNVADAEDATQAVFLILAQRAQSIRNKNDVGGWLFGVARRVALQSLRQRQRREAREKQVTSPATKLTVDLVAAQEAALLCDAELLKLPLRYRQALVLCCIEGLSKSVAARRLGWPEGTVASCVSRGKKLLADRLIRRGVLPALAAAVLTTPAVHAIPVSLAKVSTSALALVTGRSLVNTALPGAIQLFYKVQSTMLFQRRLLFLACSACLVLVGPGLLWGWHVLNAPVEVIAESEPVMQQDAGKPESPAPTPKKAETDKERLQGLWKLVAFVSNSVETKKSFSLDVIGSMIEFKEDKFIRVGADGRYDIVPGMVFRMNDRVQPKELDVTFSNGITEPGLYALDTDTLLICTTDPINGQRSRPIEISAARNGSSRIVVYRRVTPVGMVTAEEIRIAEEMMIGKVVRSLRQCVIAMHNYNNDYNRLPAHAIFSRKPGVVGGGAVAGGAASVEGGIGGLGNGVDEESKPLLSWRVELLPYLGEDALYKQFHLDEPWDSEHNKKLIPKMPAIFAHPGTKSAAEYKTHYRVFIAPAKLAEGKKGQFAPFFSMSPGNTISLEQLSKYDGNANTIAIVEATQPVIWTKPEELLIEHDETTIPSLGAIPNKDYFVAVHFDGEAHLYKRVFGGSLETQKDYYKLLRQQIGWKDGMNYDVSSILIR